MAHFEGITKRNSIDIDAWVYLGVCLSKLGRYEEGIEAYRETLLIKPDHAEASSNLGWLYGRLGRWKEAVNASKNAIKPIRWWKLTITWAGLITSWSLHQQAIEAYLQALRLKPQFAVLHNNLGMAYGALGRNADAIRAYQQAIRISPRYAEALSNLGVRYARLGQWEEAAGVLPASYSNQAGLCRAYNNLGVAYCALQPRQRRKSQATENAQLSLR